MRRIYHLVVYIAYGGYNLQKERLKKLQTFSLRGQTVHWIGAQFCVCRFLDSRDESLNMLKFCRIVLVAESAYNAQNTQFGLVMSATKAVFLDRSFI